MTCELTSWEHSCKASWVARSPASLYAEGGVCNVILSPQSNDALNNFVCFELQDAKQLTAPGRTIPDDLYHTVAEGCGKEGTWRRGVCCSLPPPHSPAAAPWTRGATPTSAPSWVTTISWMASLSAVTLASAAGHAASITPSCVHTWRPCVSGCSCRTCPPPWPTAQVCREARRRRRRRSPSSRIRSALSLRRGRALHVTLPA